MKEIDLLCQSHDLSELHFYLEYNQMILDILEKRGVKDEKLLEEVAKLQQRIDELLQNN